MNKGEVTQWTFLLVAIFHTNIDGSKLWNISPGFPLSRNPTFQHSAGDLRPGCPLTRNPLHEALPPFYELPFPFPLPLFCAVVGSLVGFLVTVFVGLVVGTFSAGGCPFPFPLYGAVVDTGAAVDCGAQLQSSIKSGRKGHWSFGSNLLRPASDKA